MEDDLAVLTVVVGASEVVDVDLEVRVRCVDASVVVTIVEEASVGVISVEVTSVRALSVVDGYVLVVTIDVGSSIDVDVMDSVVEGVVPSVDVSVEL